MLAGLPAELGVAAGAFIGTNIDNGLVATAMVAAAPPDRARRIAEGQVAGFVVLVAVAAATAIALFEVPDRVIGLLGLIPLALGVRGLIALRHPDQHQRTAEGQSGAASSAAMLVTIGAGGDNLAVYIPLFRVAGTSDLVATGLVFVIGEALLTVMILRAGRHPRTRAAATRIGAIATPLLFCTLGVLILVQANTFSVIP